jgi:aspartokinase
MTSLDTINLDELQDLSFDEENMLSSLGAKVVHSQSHHIQPIIVAAIITFLAFIFNSEWVLSKLEDVPYAKVALLGILFSSIILFLLFFS